MKNNLILIVVAALIIWNIVLSLPKKQDDTTNFELLQELHKQNERDFQEFELQIRNLTNEIKSDCTYIYSTTRSERDSLRDILNPR